MSNERVARTIVMRPIAAASHYPGEASGDCVLKLANGAHCLGYRADDGTWYEKGGGIVEPDEFGAL